MLGVPGVDDEDVSGLGKAFHSVGEGFVVDVVDFDSVEGLLGELAEATCDSLGERIDGDAFAGQETANVWRVVLGCLLGFRTETRDHFGEIDIGGKKFQQ